MKNEEQKAPTPPPPKYRGIKVMPFVIGNEAFEKLGTIGISNNLLIYLTSVFQMNSFTATNVVNVFNGTCNFGTLVGAFLSDTYFGRYNTLGFASVSSFLGMLVVTLTAAVSKLHPPDCGNAGSCVRATTGQIAFLYTGFGLLIIGASGIRPCNLAFGADQFDPKTGKRGTSSFFNWYYMTYTFGTMVSLTLIVYVQTDKSWSIGLAIPTCLMLLSCALFFMGTRLYVIVRPQGSPLVGVARVVAAAIKKRKLKLPEGQPELFDHFSGEGNNTARLRSTDQFRFLNKAAVVTPEDEIKADGSAANPWRLSTVHDVEEVKCLLKLIPIWIAGIVYFTSSIQSQNYVVFQALQADRHLGSGNFKIPAASYNLFGMLALTIWIPIFDRLVVPQLRKRTGEEGGITMLQRMGIGIALSVVAMFMSAVVETKRRQTALTKPTRGFEPRKGDIASMSGFWLVPQMVLVGLSEAFAMIGMNEFFYQQSPENMRSIVMAFVFVGLALSSYLSSFSSSVVRGITGGRNREGWLAEDLNKGRLDYFYYLFGVANFLNLIYFLVFAKWFKYKEVVDATPEVGMEKLQHEEKSPV